MIRSDILLKRLYKIIHQGELFLKCLADHFLDFILFRQNKHDVKVTSLSFRPKWNRQFSYKSAAQEELRQAIEDMPPLQLFSDVLRLDRTKKSIDEDSFADVEMWKEIISRRKQFDISEADTFHFFSHKSQLPPSVLVGGHNSDIANPFQVFNEAVLTW